MVCIDDLNSWLRRHLSSYDSRQDRCGFDDDRGREHIWCGDGQARCLDVAASIAAKVSIPWFEHWIRLSRDSETASEAESNFGAAVVASHYAPSSTSFLRALVDFVPTGISWCICSRWRLGLGWWTQLLRGKLCRHLSLPSVQRWAMFVGRIRHFGTGVSKFLYPSLWDRAFEGGYSSNSDRSEVQRLRSWSN